MFPILIRVISRYAPYITLPVAAIVGLIGYHIEDIISDKYTPYQDSISQKRKERHLERESNTTNPSQDKYNIMSGVLDRNLSPSLQTNAR